MSSERNAIEETSFLVKPLEWVTALAVRFPWTTVAIAAFISIAATTVSANRLTFRNSRADLLNPKSPYHQRWLAYAKEFGSREDIVVVVDGESPASVKAAARDAAETISRNDHMFTAVMHDVDLSRLKAKGLHYLSGEELAGVQQLVARAAPIIAGDWNELNLGSSARRIIQGLQAQAMSQMNLAAMRANPAAAMAAAFPPGAIKELDQFAQTLVAALNQRGGYRSPWPEMASPAACALGKHCSPLVTQDGHRAMVALQIAQKDRASLDPSARGVAELRSIVKQLKQRHADVAIGLTGLPVIENDEMQASQASMTRASLLSLVGVGIVFLAGFGGMRHPLIGNLALILGMDWTFGYATLAIGHLNILSSAFGAILIGQGLDFGVYYLADYLERRRESASSREALIKTAVTAGPGIATGAMSTAIAFFAAGFTEFSGVAELGLIAGGGMLLCYVAAIVLMPAMIQISDENRPVGSFPSPLDLDMFLRPLYLKPHIALGIAGGLSIVAGIGLSRLWYDHNLMHLQPVGLESVRLGQELARDANQGAYYALSVTNNREEAIARKQQLLQLPSVDRVDEIASAFPIVDLRRTAEIRQIHSELQSLPNTIPQIPTAQPQELIGTVGALLQFIPESPSTTVLRQHLAEAMQLLTQLPPAEYYARLAEFQQSLAGDLLTRLLAVREASDPTPPEPSDLPAGLTARFIGQSGKYLLKVFSKADIWDMPATERFVHELRSVDPDATGNPLQIYEASREMKRSYEEAAIYAMFIVFAVVYLDFRSLKYTLVALAPLAISMIQMFGLMGLLNIPLNPANMIVLPLILGIGVDNGVHIVHDFRRQRAEGHAYRIGGSTVNAVVINSLGNMVGFGSLMIASHQGLQSLGRVLTIGMGCCLASALIMPNAFLVFARWPAAAPQDTETESAGSSNRVADLASPAIVRQAA